MLPDQKVFLSQVVLDSKFLTEIVKLEMKSTQKVHKGLIILSDGFELQSRKKRCGVIMK